MPNISTWKSRVAQDVRKKKYKLNKWKMGKWNFFSNTRLNSTFDTMKFITRFSVFSSWKMKNVNETLVGWTRFRLSILSCCTKYGCTYWTVGKSWGKLSSIGLSYLQFKLLSWLMPACCLWKLFGQKCWKNYLKMSRKFAENESSIISTLWFE